MILFCNAEERAENVRLINEQIQKIAEIHGNVLSYGDSSAIIRSLQLLRAAIQQEGASMQQTGRGNAQK